MYEYKSENETSVIMGGGELSSLSDKNLNPKVFGSNHTSTEFTSLSLINIVDY